MLQVTVFGRDSSVESVLRSCPLTLGVVDPLLKELYTFSGICHKTSVKKLKPIWVCLKMREPSWFVLLLFSTSQKGVPEPQKRPAHKVYDGSPSLKRGPIPLRNPQKSTWTPHLPLTWVSNTPFLSWNLFRVEERWKMLFPPTENQKGVPEPPSRNKPAPRRTHFPEWVGKTNTHFRHVPLNWFQPLKVPTQVPKVRNGTQKTFSPCTTKLVPDPKSA